MHPANADPNELELLRAQKARLEEDIARLLTIDVLTGLQNRTAFINKVDAALKSVKAGNPQSALIEFGFTGLPRITGSLGRHVGDYLIAALAARLLAAAEPGTLSCRLDYKSFALFVPVVQDALAALTMAKRILAILTASVDWVDRPLTVDVTAGVALSSGAEHTAESLMQNAGLAYKSTTNRGGPGYAFFNPALALAARRRSDIHAALLEGLSANLFSLNYQPFFQAATGELMGFEALLRFNHPRLGAISPVEFIPVAESTGLISKLGSFALVEACQTATNWPSNLVVTVNVSPDQFQDGSILIDVHNALELSSLPAYRLEIEVTESTMIGDTEVVLQQLTSLRELGCGIALDDFGTGYSSLNYLWKFPFTKLKIDRSFISATDEQPHMRGIISAIMDISRTMGLKVTAEGIETQGHAELLNAMNCDYIQGFLTGKPLPAEDLAAVILGKFARELQTAKKPQVTQATQASAEVFSLRAG